MGEILKNNEGGNNEIPAAQEWSAPDRVADEPEKNSRLRLLDAGFVYDQRNDHLGEVFHNYALRLDAYDISKEAPDIYNIIQRLLTQAKNFDREFSKHEGPTYVHDTKSTIYDKEELIEASLGILPIPPEFPDAQTFPFIARASIDFFEQDENIWGPRCNPDHLSINIAYEDDTWIVRINNFNFMETDISDRKKLMRTSEPFIMLYSKKMPGVKLEHGKVSRYDDAMDHRVGGSFEMGKRR
jgi:hypothetical protein